MRVPDGVNTHGAPTFLIDVVERDGLTVVGGFLLRCTLPLGRVVRRDDVRVCRTACITQRTVFLDELKAHDAFVEGLS